MPAIETMGRHEKALLWPATGFNRYGRVVVSTDREEIDVRWLATQRQVTDPQGNTIMIEAAVIVAQEIAAGSIMWRGGVADLPGTAEVPEGDLMQVVANEDTADIKGRKVFREVMLTRYRDGDLPTE